MHKNNNDSEFLGSDYRYHKMIEEVEDYAILLLDKNGSIQNWNKGAEKIKGYSEKEVLGKNFSIFYLPEDKEKNLPQSLITQARQEGKTSHEGWRVRKDGSTFWGNVVITALHDDENNVIGFTKVTRDLTERKMAEDQQLRDAKSIEAQNRQLEEFAYVTSHDLQEPIRKIQTFAQLLKANIDNKEEVLKYLDKINTSAGKMVLLIKDVLNFSRLSQSREQFLQLDFNAVLKEVLLDFELLISEKNVTVEVSELPVLNAIPIQINQLFTNIISNAIKFNMGVPVIKITSEVVYNDSKEFFPEQSPKFYKIAFEDNGIGFDQKYAEQAFQPFKRLTAEYNGTGIGLALCKRIIENHGGKIEVYSKPGRGTTFVLYFPYNA
jgi:PAS domain S-box-containing protein